MNRYFQEILNRVIIVLFNFVISFLVSYYYKEFFLLETLAVTKQVTAHFIVTNVTEIFLSYIQILSLFSFVSCFIFILFHIFVFISPGLYKVEYLGLKLCFQIMSIFCFLSLWLSYHVFVPAFWSFFINCETILLNKSLDLYVEITVFEYITFFLKITQSCIFYSQVCIFLGLLFLQVKNDKKLVKNYRNLFYFCFLMISTFVTPPDVVSQIISFLVLVLLFEILIFYRLTKRNLIR